MTDKIKAHHFVDPAEADFPAGAYTLGYSERGLPNTFTAYCPCGCGASVHLMLFPFNTEGIAGWNLSGSHGRHSLYPHVMFLANDNTDSLHWEGWLLEGNWIRTGSPELKLANPGLNMVGPELPRGERALESAE